MHIWIVTIGEPLPSDGNDVRLLRHGLLAEELVNRGCKITWWTSSFDHQRKKQRFETDTKIEINPQYELRVVKSLGYSRNVSLARLRDHRLLAKNLSEALSCEAVLPDLILCSFPPPELAELVTDFAQKHRIPVVLDIRDMWPDIFCELAPSSLHWAINLLTHRMRKSVQRATQHADYLVAMSQTVLDWGLKHANRKQSRDNLVFPLAYSKQSIPPGELADSRAKMRTLGVNEEKTICWYIGTIGRRYDVPTIVGAARQLASEGRNDIQFVVSGDGDLLKSVKATAAGLDNIVFTGWIGTRDIAAMMQMAKVGIVAIDAQLPTLPNKMFEYFASGLPVVSCVPGEAAEIITNNQCGINYIGRNSCSLKTAVCSLIADEATRAQMGANAQRIYETQFTVSTVYGNYAKTLIDWAQRPYQSLRKAS